MPLRDNYNHCSVYCILHVIFCHLKAALDQGRDIRDCPVKKLLSVDLKVVV